jgi:hypothetical protein
MAAAAAAQRLVRERARVAQPDELQVKILSGITIEFPLSLKWFVCFVE